MLSEISFTTEFSRIMVYTDLFLREGNINLRIPFRSSFRLVATAPSTRKISLGSFRGGEMKYLGNGRRIIGKIGNGSASLTVTNKFGTISFIPR